MLGGGGLWAQSLPPVTPEVINSAGGSYFFSNDASVMFSVGEPFTETMAQAAGPLLTQGFIQPDAVGAYSYTVNITKSDVTCSDKDDGKISTAITALSPSAYTVTYIWTPSVACPGSDCPSLDSLRSGFYTLTALVSYKNLAGAVKVMSATVLPSPNITIADVNGPCKVKIFTGVNINGGQNGHLHIENISEFPNNRLTVYNRWGAQLYDQQGYDNVTKFWPASDDQGKLLPSTYFYVLDLGDGSKPLKGWIELIKN